MDKLRSFLISAGGAAVGAVFVLILWHAYNDHLAIHQIIAALTQPKGGQ